MNQASILYSAASAAAGARAAAALEGAAPGIKVRLADGLAAVEAALSSGGCDLLLSDYGQAGFDAPALLHTRNALSPLTPVIFLDVPAEKCPDLLSLGAEDAVTGDQAARLPCAVQAALTRAARGRRTARAAEDLKMAALGRLAGGVAHDFNNILGAIEGYATLNLRRLAPEDPLREDLGEIRKAVARASSLNRQLLLFGRTYPVQARPVPVDGLMENLRKTLETQAPGLALEFQTPAGLPPAGGDPAELGQALVNLVLNARDARPGGLIRVKAEALPLGMVEVPGPDLPLAAVYLKLSVADSGPGVPAEIKDSMFEPLFSTKGKGKGSGLGLSAVYGIARRHRGWVEVKSSPSGAEFSLLLPAFAAAPEPEAAAPRPGARSCAGGGLVLVIEDDADLLAIAGKGLQSAGYDTALAETLGKGLALLRERGGEVKAIFADISLPDGSSTEHAEEISRLAPGACLIFVSGYDQREEVLRLAAGRGFRFMPKPYSIDALLAAVAACFKI